MLNVKSCLISSVIAVCAFASIALAQPQRAGSIIHDLHTIRSSPLDEERTILVHVPVSYESTSERYPVVYMLDGHTPQVEMMGGILGHQAWGGQIPEMILVSIQNTNRSRDLTPTVDARGGNVGGADKFLEFIKTEVIPLVEKNYRTQPYRIFAGHSLGGLAVVYSMVSRPDLFNAYIAASPVLHYDNDFVIKETEKLFKQKHRFDKTIFLALGDEPQYKAGWSKFQKLLKRVKPKGFDYEFKEFGEENHGSVVLRAYYWGLRKIYEGWIPGKIATLSALESHYRKLTKRFGYTINIPEPTLNQIGYKLLRDGKNDDAILVFKKNVQTYPASANAYDSLGSAYEKNGSKKKARENYEKAYNLAKAKGDKRLADIFKTNLARVSKN